MAEQGGALGGCHGNGRQHCCYIPGTGVADPAGTKDTVCPFLEVDTIPGRHWVCGLRRQLGSWDRVHRNPAYKTKVLPVWEATGTESCGDWRTEGQCCFGPDNEQTYNIGE